MKIKSEKDFFCGLLFMVAGVAFAWASTTYTIGDAARMGPGYFPLLLGVVLALLGALVTFLALTIETEDGGKVGAWAWRPLGCIVASNVAFGVLLGGLPSLHVPPMGMILAIVALTFFAALAGSRFDWKEVAILAAVLAAGSYAVFVLALKLQFAVWPTFIQP